MLFLAGSPAKSFYPSRENRSFTPMKNITIRAFVVALALVGFASTAHSKTTGHTVVANMGGMPVPMCPPSDPNGCGID
jgi:hypothetical protein